MSDCTVIIVAAGKGERMNAVGEKPKQYREIGGRAVLARTVAAFCSDDAIDRVLVVIRPGDEELYAAAVPAHPKVCPPVQGGATRQESVLRGLLALQAEPPDIVLIHDAARPMVDAETIAAVVAATGPGICALAGHPVPDTLKSVDDHGSVLRTVDRKGLYCAQTPQGFDYRDILAAHLRSRESGAPASTDDAQIAEQAGMTVRIVPSPASNFKITTEADLEMARMRFRIPDVRTGNGYDVHRLVPGDSIILCGVRIEHPKQLDGHSDADVGLHALTDALLATIADGDIGSHFPPSDPVWKGASSDRFLAHAVHLVLAAGGTITHLDVTLVCEAPRIGPHRDQMRAALSRITGVDISRISVKATTNERLGFLGREEGIAAFAAATAVFTPE